MYDRTKENMNNLFLRKFGISLADFTRLDILEQERLLDGGKKKKKVNYASVIANYGNKSLVARINKDDKLSFDFSDNIKKSLTLEEAKVKRYGRKPFVKKLK